VSSLTGSALPATATPCILVVDDDRRVVDLLNIALAAHGYRVITASDGEEAVRMALGKRPDLVVLDVRLPKKSGLEVCEILRQDPDDPHLPIIMVSAASETEARLQGFARGADDYLAKPFSPKELVARIKRLLARASEARESRRRGREAVSAAALLAAERAGGPFVPLAIRGDGLERVAGLEVRPDGELGTLLAGMGRPVRRAELERFPELRPELRAFVATGMSLLAPLRGTEDLEGLLVADERLDGEDSSRLDIDVLTLLCGAAAVGLANARRCRALADGLIETLVARAGGLGPEDDSEARVEAASLAERAARVLRIPPRARGLIAHGVALGAWAESAVGRHALALAAAADPTGRLLDLAHLVDGDAGTEGDDGEATHEREAVLLLRVARDYATARGRGCAAPQALARAMDAVGGRLDDATRRALSGAAREVTPPGANGRPRVIASARRHDRGA